MNVSCTSCQTVFRVDPAKVPVKGIRARCSVCSGVFWVRHSLPVEPVPPPPAVPESVVPPAQMPTTPSPRPAPTWAAPPPAVARRPPPSVSPPPAQRFSGPATPPPRPVAAPTPAARPPAALPSPPATAFRTAASPAASPPAAPTLAPVPAPVPIEPTARKGRSNPFLSQDPAAKARRLARALISDMVVYHPAKRREGIQNGSLKQLFDEEIRKSWEEYVDQVGRDLAETTPFFNNALNEILADGQLIFP